VTNVVSFFAGRQAAIATMHGKERAIAPLLEQHLGIATVLPANIDTDQFGTFTRDVARAGTLLDAARAKAREGMRLAGVDLGIASEGAFGPHPASPFLSLNTELVLLVDARHGLEIAGAHFATKTNHRQKTVRSPEEAMQFAQAIGFPQHALVVRRSEHDAQGMAKGVNTFAALEQHVAALLESSAGQSVFLETDMRAHTNPTRMENIRLAAEDLVKNALRACPDCNSPGFALSERKPGLPCEWCGRPTAGILADVYTCAQCGYSHTVMHPDGREHADAGHCERCNP
jgi:hypothetical protein